MAKDDNRLLLTPREAAATLAVSERKLWDLTNKGDMTSLTIGRSVRYRVADLIEWIDRRTSMPANAKDETSSAPNDSSDLPQTPATSGTGGRA